jgi:hypothetical protein
MKKTALAGLLIAVVVSLAATAQADRYTRGTSDNPLRLVRYVLHPIGLAAEFLVMRPIHWVVSQPHLDIVFGHKATTFEAETYFEWSHGDFSPSIAAEASKAPKPTSTAAGQ